MTDAPGNVVAGCTVAVHLVPTSSTNQLDNPRRPMTPPRTGCYTIVEGYSRTSHRCIPSSGERSHIILADETGNPLLPAPMDLMAGVG